MKTLETERLILRQWEMDDIHDHFEYAKSELVGPQAGWKPEESLQDAEALDCMQKSRTLKSAA